MPAPLLSLYHYLLAEFGALAFGFPSRKLLIVAVTGTKGKSSTTEMVNAILEEAGYKTALLNSIRVKIGKDSKPNLMRMSMPGRFFIQRFLRDALRTGCTAAVLEMTSEGARQHRHRGIELDALIFTNLAPEHIESHGSYEAYADAKFEIGRQLARSRKRARIIVANADDAQSPRYLSLPIEEKLPFALSSNPPWFADDQGGYVTFDGVKIPVHFPGEFSLKNALAATTLAKALGIEAEVAAQGLDTLRTIPGRAERIEAGQPFTVIVDYAHTPDSLEALYSAYEGKRKICVLGSMGGSRDTWNRPVKGRLAAQYCAEVIFTNEDPCDDDPVSIIQQIADGAVGKKTHQILDRREAIRRALEFAQAGDAVLITGKGTDPWIYGPSGTKIPWSDAGVAREELEKLLRR